MLRVSTWYPAHTKQTSSKSCSCWRKNKCKSQFKQRCLIRGVRSCALLLLFKAAYSTLRKSITNLFNLLNFEPRDHSDGYVSQHAANVCNVCGLTNVRSVFYLRAAMRCMKTISSRQPGEVNTKSESAEKVAAAPPSERMLSLLLGWARQYSPGTTPQLPRWLPTIPCRLRLGAALGSLVHEVFSLQHMVPTQQNLF